MEPVIIGKIASEHEDRLKTAFKNLKTHDQFLECCKNGGDNDLEIMKKILNSDPKK